MCACVCERAGQGTHVSLEWPGHPQQQLSDTSTVPGFQLMKDPRLAGAPELLCQHLVRWQADS